jgi:hypothetical protein
MPAAVVPPRVLADSARLLVWAAAAVEEPAALLAVPADGDFESIFAEA